MKLPDTSYTKFKWQIYRDCLELHGEEKLVEWTELKGRRKIGRVNKGWKQSHIWLS